MTLPDPTTTTAAVTAAAYAALHAGHWIGDYPVQRDEDAQAKGHPDDDMLAISVHPWTGWWPCTRHCLSYLTSQAVMMFLISLVAPLTWNGAWTALAISGATHAVIDRRWIVKAIIRHKGGCAHWPGAPAHLDQALHQGVLLLAAIGAATVTTVAGALSATVICIGLIAVALAWEFWHGRILADRLVPTVHVDAHDSPTTPATVTRADGASHEH